MNVCENENQNEGKVDDSENEEMWKALRTIHEQLIYHEISADEAVEYESLLSLYQKGVGAEINFGRITNIKAVAHIYGYGNYNSTVCPSGKNW